MNINSLLRKYSDSSTDFGGHAEIRFIADQPKSFQNIQSVYESITDLRVFIARSLQETAVVDKKRNIERVMIFHLKSSMTMDEGWTIESKVRDLFYAVGDRLIAIDRQVYNQILDMPA